MEWVYDDGGRSSYFKGEAGDCVTRAIAIATEQDYKKVYDELAAMNKARYGKKSARNGIHRDDIKKYMADHGWMWCPKMRIGSGCTVHMRRSELPRGRVMCSLSRHIATVVDGVLHDTYDSSRDGERCVYGYWIKDDAPKRREPRISRAEFESKMGMLVDDFELGLISPQELGKIAESLAIDRRGA